MFKRIFKKPWINIILIIMITVFFGIQLPKLNINNEVKIFLPDDHPSKNAYDKMEKIYGSGDVIAVSYENVKNSIFSLESIKLLDGIIQDLENIENVKEATGLVNTDFIKGTADGMEVKELVENKPQNKKDIYEIKKKVLSWDIYENNLYNEDYSSSQILVKAEKDLSIEQKEDIYWDIKNVIKKYKNKDSNFYIAGMPAVNVLIGNNMESDLSNLIPFVIGIVLLILFLSFRNAGGVILPTVTVLISTVWALGIMSLLGISLTIVSTVIPVLLVAVGSAYGIHIISHYYDEIRNENKKISKKQHKEIIITTVKKVGKPVFLAGLTTMVGFGSLASSNIMPVKSFGIFTAVGVGVALLVALIFIPSILLVRSRRLSGRIKRDKNAISKIIDAIYGYFSKKRIRILILSFIIIIISIVGIKKIVIDSVMIEFFKEDTEIRQADRFINNNFSGTHVLNILIDGKENGALTDPDILKEMDNLSRYLENRYSRVGKVTSFADFIKRMNKVMNYPAEEKSQNPENKSGNIKEETTSDFGNESTSEFDSETTSSFGNNSNNETTSDFGSENTSEFKQKTEEKKSKKIPGNFEEDKTNKYKKLTGRQFVELLNEAILNSKKSNITADQLVKLINREINYRGEAYNEIPYDVDKYPAERKKGLKDLISQYLLLYAGNLDDLINDQIEPSKARMMIQMKSGSNILTDKIEESVSKYVDDNFPEGYKVSVAGTSDMALAVNNLIVSSQLKSIIISLIVVFIIVSINFRSFVGGIYGVIPLSFALLINFGIMGFFGIKLDIATSMVAAIAIGIGVDYTVHFLTRYHQERLENDDIEEVTRNTLKTTGKAIIFNAISVAAGFAVLLFSNFNPLVNLGLLVSITMVTSSLASMTILPALLNQFKPKFISEKRR